MAGLIVLVAARLALAAPPDSGQPGADANPVPTVPRSLLLDYLADASTFTLIDARSPEEFAASHVDGAINIPHERLDAHLAALPESLAAPLVIYCRTGRRAGKLREQLEALGYRDVRTLTAAQIHWGDGFAVFNCSAGAGTPPTAFLKATDQDEE